MLHKNLLLMPEILSRLIFTQSDIGDFYVQATPQQKARLALPEEIIRQLFILSLIHHYGYPENRLRLEFGVQMGRTKKRADIVILDHKGHPYIVIEVKQELGQNAIDQLESYVTITRASFGVAVSTDKFYCMTNNGAQQDDFPLFGDSADIFENKDTNQKINNEPSRLSLQIEGFDRISQTHAEITVKGHTIKLSNIDLASYKKLQRHFLAVGVVINTEIKQQDWLVMFTKLLDITPITPIKIATTPPVNDDIDIVVADLLEYSNDPLCGTDVTCFTPLFAKLHAKLPGILKKDKNYRSCRVFWSLFHLIRCAA